MANIKAFQCIRPNKYVAHRVAALPYDVYNRKEAKEEALKDQLSFLNIDRAETQFEDSVDIYDDKVYKRAKELLEDRIADGTFLLDSEEAYYVYELTMLGRTQTGVVACSSIDDYCNNVIKKHENTREDKEQDRIRHVDVCSAQTGPIFLAYRENAVINQFVKTAKEKEELYAFTSDDGIRHRVWKISDVETVTKMKEAFDRINHIYIADGHHRAASAVKVGLKRREENKQYRGDEEFNFFLSVLFPDSELMIMPYNRAVKDLNGLSKEEFLRKISKSFKVKEITKEPFAPKNKGSFGMYLSNTWYELVAKPEILETKDPVKRLDVSILQDYLLNPVLGIGDPRTDKRIDFIGGIRGLHELENRVSKDMRVAFSMFPTSISELFEVSDADMLMPPKSTWFEPKLRSGLFIHRI